VLLSRCAWHPRYHGYPLVEGVASWSGWGVKFTDGICTDCATRFRAEYQAFFERRRREAPHEIEVRRQVA
jgi:hypothetical protein